LLKNDCRVRKFAQFTMKRFFPFTFAASALLLAGCCSKQPSRSDNQPWTSPQWSSQQPAARGSVEWRLRSQGKHWIRTPGEITIGSYVQDILEGRLNQPQGRGAIGKVVSITTGDNGSPSAVVDFGRNYSVPIYFSELSLVKIVPKH
jgi:hypothetical protein